MDDIKLPSELLEPLILKHSYKNISFFLKIKDYLSTQGDKNYFNDPKFQKTFNIMVKWYNKFAALPRRKDFELILEKTEKDEEIRFFYQKIVDNIFEESEQEITDDFLEQEVKDFIIQSRSIEATLLNQVDIEKGDYSQIAKRMQEAITVNFDKDLGVSIKDLQKVKNIVDSKQRDKLIETGFSLLDQKLGGGVAGGEIFVVGAPPKIGKTLFLGNIALNAFKNDKNVLVYTLEVSDARLLSRYYKNLLSYANINSDTFITDNEKSFDMFNGDLIVKEFAANSVSSNDLLAHINDLYTYKKWKPDIIIIDYLLILKTNDFRMSPDNSFKYYKTVTEEVRNIANALSIPIFTASQMNREAMDERGGTKAAISSAAISESRGIIDTTDYFSVLIQTAAQRRNNMMRLFVGENRNGEGHFYIDLEVDYDKLSIKEKQ